jgi:hypothetical protein
MLSQQEVGIDSSIKVPPVCHVDPMICALNTMMYGLVVHVGTMWAFGPDAGEKEEDFCLSSQEQQQQQQVSATLASILLAHEYWVYLQHTNVLANPLCQRLDRRYGIALLRSNKHWAIAGTLSAYWCRENLSMFLCLPFVSGYTRHLVLYSLVYHTIKSRGIRQDALRRYSPTFGIMRIVIDHFYHHTYTEQLVSLVRLFLQGLDTFIHAMIISDLFASPLVRSSDSATFNIHCLFATWVLHAACNQWFTCSTATIMVQAWYTLTATTTSKSPAGVSPHLCDISDSESDESASRNGDDGSSSSSCSCSSGTEENNFEVRRLLRPGRVPDRLKGKQGAASNGVDSAIRLETVVATIAAVYAIGLADTPFRVLLMDSKSLVDNKFYNANTLWVNLLFGWLLYGIFHALSVFLLPTSSKVKKSADVKIHQNHGRTRSILFAFDVAIIIIGTSCAKSSSRAMLVALLLGVGITVKSFLKSAKWRGHKALWMTICGIEILAKAFLGRLLVEGREESVALVGALVCTVWGCITVASTGSASMENTEEPSRFTYKVADTVFLGHPAELSDFWALWLLPYSLDERWRRPWWTVPLWPFHYVVGYYACNFRAKLFGDGASFFNCDDVNFVGVQLQTWTSAHFGRHFVTSKRAVRQNIEAAARHADDIGVKVLCLGALNKAESINGGGVGVARALGENRRISIIHGNHLTAAAVVETAHECFGENASVFLTGNFTIFPII